MDRLAVPVSRSELFLKSGEPFGPFFSNLNVEEVRRERQTAYSLCQLGDVGQGQSRLRTRVGLIPRCGRIQLESSKNARGLLSLTGLFLVRLSHKETSRRCRAHNPKIRTNSGR